MALKTFVKISDITNLSDARYCAGMGVDLLGFNVDPKNPRRIDPEKFKSIAEWVAGVQFAGEFDQSGAEEILQAAEKYPLDYIQVNDWETLAALQGKGYKLSMEVQVRPEDRVDEVLARIATDKDLADFFLISSFEGECGSFIEHLAKSAPGARLALGCGINAENVGRLIALPGVMGVALRGGEEIRPGYKDFDELADILETLEVE